MSTLGWRTFSHTGAGANCVEVAPTEQGVLLRDTKDRGDGPVIAFTPAQWTAFLNMVDTAATIHQIGTETHLRTGAVTLRFTASEWAAFRSGVQDGEFDLLARA
ncbi:MAG: DUF397 domain-containing protein [Actinomycetota bacterium]|nr:DUF397 domain-containing protein [Actinomycetota bacterium]